MEENKNILIYNTDDGKTSVSLYANDGNIWMNQNQIAELFDTSKQNVSLHIQNILKEKEIKEKTSVKEYLTDLEDGRKFNITFYSLDMILAIGFRVKSIRGTQFRIWATNVLRKYITQGYVLNQKRLEQDSKKWCLLQTQMENLKKVLDSRELSSLESNALIKVVTDYTKALNLIESVDRNSIPILMSRKVCKI